MDTVTLPSNNTTKFCRLCLSQINLLKVIERNATDQASNAHLLDLIRTHISLPLDKQKDFPCAVCEMCITLLNEVSVLHKNAPRYSAALREVLQQSSPMSKLVRHPETNVQSADESTVKEENSLVEIYDGLSYNVIKTEQELHDENKRILLEHEIVLEEFDITELPNDAEKNFNIYALGDGSQEPIVENHGQVVVNMSDEQTAAFVKQQELPKEQPRKHLVAQIGRKRLIPFQRPLNIAHPTTPEVPLPIKLEPALLSTPQPLPRKALTLNSAQPTAAQEVLEDTAQSKPPAKQLFRCDSCSSRFVELSNYYNHSCKKPYKEIKFNRNVRSVPVDIDIQKYRCRACNAGYRSLFHFNKHQYELHGICSDDFGLKCTICTMQFSQRQDYELHVKAMHPKDMEFTIDLNTGETRVWKRVVKH
ncbi:uncharacterized protein LOC128273270 [Anopheles cruzii]|uniref:uncharacterized protein LOC128273270 n=1 Tax=Anopheles cruzii TaxID=68878 RepID=UPI0022EC4AE7|nr:uncharacterized protein LOC128273270 [Anopheles cruzii]